MPDKQTRPNLLFVFADQLRLQSCGYAGDAKAHTPNMDRLAAQGVSFANAVSSTPVCSAFRASLLTGKYTTTTGMVINELRLSPDHECFGHVLTRVGYQTGYIGKWHLWANQLGHHDEVRNAFVPPGPYRLGFDGYWAAYNFHHIYRNAYYFRDEPKKIRYGGPDVYEPDAQTDLAVAFLERAARARRPFALFLSYGTPHDPWTWANAPKKESALFRRTSLPNPPNYSPRNDPYADAWAVFRRDERQRLETWRRIYYAMTANLDANLGRLLTALDRLGLRQKTIVVFTSDHGEMFGAHGRRAKNIFYEEAIRIPFVIRWTGTIPAGHATDACLSTPDMMPTLLSLMGLPTPRDVEGMDLSHLALGKQGPEPDAAFLQGTGTTAAWRDGHEWRAVRDKRFTYAIYRRDRAELLFDNRNDPLQMKNLVREKNYADQLERLRSLLRRKMAQLNDTFETCTWYRDHWTRDRNILRGARGGTHDLQALAEVIHRYLPESRLR